MTTLGPCNLGIDKCKRYKRTARQMPTQRWAGQKMEVADTSNKVPATVTTTA